MKNDLASVLLKSHGVYIRVAPSVRPTLNMVYYTDSQSV